MDVFNVMATMTLMDMISAPLRAIRAQMKTTGNTADGLGSRMGKLAKALLPLAAAAGIVLASLISPIRAAGDFEAAMSRVGAVSNATPAEMLKLSRATRELGATTEWSAMQVAEGQKYLAMAGFTVQQNVAALPAVLNMASAGATDLGRAADISSDILSAFNLEASQMPRVADTLTAAFTTSNTSLELLGETMKYVAPVAEKAGLSIESTAAMAGLLGNVGIKGSQAGTALRSMLNGLAAPSSEASKAIAKLGVQTMDAAGNLRSPIAILQDMAKATETMGSAQKMAFTKTVFGTEAMSAVLALFDKAGSGGIAKYAAQLHAAGTAAEIAAKQNDNWRGDIKSLGSAFESLEITIGSLFLPAMRGITTVATGVVRTLDALAGHPVGRFLISLAAVAGTAVLAITVLTLAVWAGTTAWGALSAVLMANPIIIVAMALVALGAGLVALYNECAPVRSAFQYLGNIFSLIGERLGGELGAAFFVFKDVLSEVGDAFGSLWTSISACFAPLADLTGVADGSGWRFFGEVIGVVIGGAFRLLAAGVRVALTPLRMVLSSLTTVIDLFSGKISLAEAGRKLVSTFVAGIKSMAMAPFKAVKGVLSRVRQLLPFSDAKEGPLSSLTRSGRAMMDTLGSGVRAAAPGLVKTAAGALAGVAMAVSPTISVDAVAGPQMTPPELATPVAQDVSGTARWQPQGIQPPVLPNLLGTASWQADQIDLQRYDMPIQQDVSGAAMWQPQDIQPLVQPQFDVPSVPTPEPPRVDMSGIQAGQSRTGRQTATAGGNAGRTTITIQNLNLPGVADGKDFVQQLLALVERFDGGTNG